RTALLPTRAQVDAARTIARAARDRLRGRMEITLVLPDYHRPYPKACMDGWGRRYLVVTPSGHAQPCHRAGTIDGLAMPSVRDGSLAAAWIESAAFRAFRGDAWMPEPCRSCERRDVDFGGCRCQAFALTGDAAATDPACALAPDHALVRAAIDDGAPAPALVPRVQAG